MTLSPFDLLKLTCASLRGNLLRSGLTTFGVFMGVAAVTATLQVRQISREIIAKQLAEREAPQVELYMWQEGRGLQLSDLDFIRQRLENVQAISGASSLGRATALFQAQEAEPEAIAVSQDYLLTSGRLVVGGRFFTAADFDNYRAVVVIDEFLVDELFQGQQPLNKRLYLDKRPYTVVGVLETKQGFFGRPRGLVLLPISMYMALTGQQNVDTVLLRPENLEDMSDLEEQGKKLLQTRFPEAEVYAWNNVRRILQQKETLELASKALLSVGAIALLVGGVGIANITIATVMERTGEIGLRRAIGATQQDIMFQFILEALLLSLFGGIGAIIMVHGLTVVITERFELPYEFNLEIAGLSLGSALLVGVGAGFLPALRASQLDPVKALRSQ